jgi:hypothetical protein
MNIGGAGGGDIMGMLGGGDCTPSLRGAKRRNNPDCRRGDTLDCFAEHVIGAHSRDPFGSQ